MVGLKRMWRIVTDDNFTTEGHQTNPMQIRVVPNQSLSGQNGAEGTATEMSLSVP